MSPTVFRSASALSAASRLLPLVLALLTGLASAQATQVAAPAVVEATAVPVVPVAPVAPVAAVAPAKAQTVYAATAVQRLTDRGTPDPAQPAEAGLGDEIEVTVKALTGDTAEWSTWVLYLDGIAIPDLRPENQLFEKPIFRFHLRRNPDDAGSREAWRKLFADLSFTRTVTVHVGPVGGAVDPKAGPAAKMSLVVVPRARFVAGLIGFGALTWAFVKLARGSHILRDRGQATLQFSLARTQLAFWFLLVVGAYLFIGLITWDYQKTALGSSLTIFGISAATLGGAALVMGPRSRRLRNPEPHNHRPAHNHRRPGNQGSVSRLRPTSLHRRRPHLRRALACRRDF